MHLNGQVIEEALADEDVDAADTVVMEIGEISSVAPHYFESCFPAARERPLLRNAKLEMNIIPAAAEPTFPLWKIRVTARNAAVSTKSFSADGSSTSRKCVYAEKMRGPNFGPSFSHCFARNAATCPAVGMPGAAPRVPTASAPAAAAMRSARAFP